MSSQAWESLGESIQFRKVPLYYLGWDCKDEELSKGLVTGCPFGGPIAILREDVDLCLEVSLFSQSGHLLKRFVPSTFKKPTERLTKGGVGWRDETLVLISESGIITAIESYSGKESQTQLHRQVICVSWQLGGFLCLSSSDGCFISVNGLINGQPPILEYIKRQDRSWQNQSILSLSFFRSYSDHSIFNILVSTQAGRILRNEVSSILVEKETNELQLENRILRTSASPTGRFWAMSDDRGTIFILDDQTFRILLTINTEAEVAPLQITWCGEEAVAACFPQDLGLLLVGSQGDWIKFAFPSPVILVSEVDCIRIITKTSHELLQKVPSSVDAAFRIGSCAPSAMLVDASELVTSGDARAYEAIRALRLENELNGAILECIRAALCQFDVDEQQVLLRAAAGGKVFLSESNERKTSTKAFYKACIHLRVLNVVRHENIGLPLTFVQLEKSGGLINLCLRLARWGHHFLGIKVLDLAANWVSSRIVMQTRNEIAKNWSSRLIAYNPSSLSPTELVSQIRKKVQSGFSDLALEAYKLNKHDLALKLCEHERILSKRVGRLLQFGQYELALNLTRLGQDKELEAYVQSKFGTKKETDKEPKSLSPFFQRMKKDQIQFEAKRKGNYSLIESIRLSIGSTGLETEAYALKKEFGVSDLSYWVARVHAYIGRKDWVKLEKVAKERINRLGIVVNACLMLGFKVEGKKFISLMQNNEEKLGALLDCGEYQESIQLVKSPGFGENKSVSLLEIKSRVTLDDQMSRHEREEMENKIVRELMQLT